MIYVLFGISLTINIILIVGLILVFKFRAKFKNDIGGCVDFEGFLNDDYNFLDKM